MLENELKQNVARNITALRKKHNMTQADLAERLNYSDKSISKWERGDGLPDIFVLARIAELFGVTLNDLVSSEQADAEQSAETENSLDAFYPRRTLITALCVGLVWFIATLMFFLLKVFLPDAKGMWLSFIYALPVSSIILVVFTHMWWKNVARCLSVSSLVWMLTLCVQLTATLISNNVRNMWLIYFAAAAFQVLVILWYVYRHVRKKHGKVSAKRVVTDEDKESGGESEPEQAADDSDEQTEK